MVNFNELHTGKNIRVSGKVYNKLIDLIYKHNVPAFEDALRIILNMSERKYSSLQKTDKEWQTIRISKRVYNELSKKGTVKDTFNDVVERLISKK